MVKRGEALLAAGEPEASLRFAENALAVAPLFLRALQLRADSLFALGDAARALVVLVDASHERAMPAYSFACMSEYAATLGQAQRATEYANHARTMVRERDVHTAKRLVKASRALIANGQPGAALGIARGATVIDPRLGDAWVILARDALLRGDPAQCARALARATEPNKPSGPNTSSLATESDPVDPADPVVNREIGEISLAIGNIALAAKHLRRAWVCGDRESVAPLVVALWRLGDTAGMLRVFSDAEGTLATMAKALFALGNGDRPEGLAEIWGSDIPDALWPLALESALKFAPLDAERWAEQAPSRASSTAILAVKSARTALESGEPARARTLLDPALADDRTKHFAQQLFDRCCHASWHQQLATQLEELAVMLREELAVVSRDDNALASLEQELRALRRELDAPLRVALLGEFSAGKSTFLNAMVGAKVSPMGVLPTTAQVHWLRFGEAGARVVDRRGTAILCTIDEAPRVVERLRNSNSSAAPETLTANTAPSANASVSGVEYVEVTWPAPRLARIELIDTPGFNAGDAGHERAVRSAFAMADVALWLFDARQAGKSSESTPLEEAKSADLPVLGVLNKIDTVAPSALSSVVRVLVEGFSELAPLVLTVSTREGLAAQLVLEDPNAGESAKNQAKVKLAASGFASLLTYLDEHLVNQRLQWKQLRVARRAMQLVAQAEQQLAKSEQSTSQKTLWRESLLAAIAVMRESLGPLLLAARKEVATVLGSQMKGLDSRALRSTSTMRGVDAEELASDAAAEVRWRVREKAVQGLAPGLAELERLAVGAGVVAPESVSLVSATTYQALEEAVREGVRDAQMATLGQGARGIHATSTGLGYDPFAALEQAVFRSDHHEDDRTARLRAALAVARQELAIYRAPTVPHLTVSPANER